MKGILFFVSPLPRFSGVEETAINTRYPELPSLFKFPNTVMADASPRPPDWNYLVITRDSLLAR
jgi:hypothetical protein